MDQMDKWFILNHFLGPSVLFLPLVRHGRVTRRSERGVDSG